MGFHVSCRARATVRATATAFAVVASVAVVGVSLTVQGLGGAPGPPAGRGCAEPFEGVRSPDITYFVASPLADTVPDPAASTAAGFGQLADASRIGGAAAELLGPTLAADPRVVLVPWGFDDRCRTIAWTGPWRWATTGSVGFYRGRLRSADAWIDGQPTFDVAHAVWEGFPASPWEHPLSAGRPGLSATELFELYERLPTPGALATRPYGAVSGLVEWRRDAGEALDRYPSRALLTAAFRTADLVRLRTTHLPFSGTYRVRVESPDGDSLAAFLMRTGAVGSEPLDPGTEEEGVPAAPVPARSFAVAAALATTGSGLAAVTPASSEIESTSAGGCFRPMGLRALAEETVVEDATRAWSAELVLSFLDDCFPNASIYRGLQPYEDGTDGAAGQTDEEAPADASAESAESGNVPGGFTGSFRHEADGRFTFRQSASLPDGRGVRLVGTRIELAALPEPPALPARLR